MEHLRRGEPIDDLLEPYRSVERIPRPGPPGCWVLANMVTGLDGCAAIGGRVGALSGGLDAELFLAMRGLADMVLVGAETVRREGYGPIRLTDAEQSRRRAEGRAAVPAVAVVSRSLSLDLASRLFTGAPAGSPTVVVTCEAADRDRRAEVADVAEVLVAGEQRVEPARALAALAARGARVVLCEGGPTLLGEVVAAGLLDELCLTVAPVMGGDPLPVSVTPAGAELSRFELAGAASHDGTLFLRYLRPQSSAAPD